ncbi:MAG: PCRF domain-containing protein, partial [Candidatus Omnitrophica bacterium]|nr:PCRF domain-containing protein [Candidatus Omnitrophota bacterium]
MADLSAAMSEPGFWDDSDKSTRIVRQLKTLKSTVEPWDTATKKYQELQELADILKPQDNALYSDLNKDIHGLSSEVGGLEFKTLLSGEFDPNNAIL